MWKDGIGMNLLKNDQIHCHDKLNLGQNQIKKYLQKTKCNLKTRFSGLKESYQNESTQIQVIFIFFLFNL